MISGAPGGSYGESMPVNSGSSPARARAYSPLGSRLSQTASGQPSAADGMSSVRAAEIVEDLEAALEQFREIAGDLGE